MMIEATAPIRIDAPRPGRLPRRPRRRTRV